MTVTLNRPERKNAFSPAMLVGAYDAWKELDENPDLRVGILTGTLGKALGGASGGYVAARKNVVDWLRQRSRPYLFSNSLAPAIVAAGIAARDLVEKGGERRARL